MNTTLGMALRFRALGYSVLAILPDGSKRPAGEWKVYQRERADESTLHRWFNRQRYGIGLIHGAVSGNSEVVDIDSGEIFDALYVKALEAVSALASAPLIRTPREGGGYQIFYRNVDPPSGNLVLARRPDPEQPGKYKTAVETRGEGGYTLTIGSPAECHPAKLPYRLISGSFRTIPTLTNEERAALHAIALGFNQAPAVGRHIERPSGRTTNGDRPGDEFNRRVSWEQILEPHGWRQRRGLGGAISHWCRPGKSFGTSATTNYADTDLLYVFSSNAEPFEGCRAYTKFAAFALLRHHGDFTAAARALGRWGFGR